MPANDPSYYPNSSRPAVPGSQFHTFLPQEKAAEDIFGPASQGRPFVPRTAADPYPSPQTALQGLHLVIANASDDSTTLQDMLKELRHRLQPVLRSEPCPGEISEAVEGERQMSPMAQEIRGISSSLGVSKYIINDILARLEV